MTSGIAAVCAHPAAEYRVEALAGASAKGLPPAHGKIDTPGGNAPACAAQNAWSQDMLRRIAELISPTML